MAKHTICSIDNCCKPVKYSGMCSMHITRKERYGDPHIKIKPRNEVMPYFENVVLEYEGDECLIWPFTKTKGYPWIWYKGKGEYATRVICEQIYGPAPTDKHQAAHSCGKGHLACVTKKHLRWATPLENSIDALNHGTRIKGEKQGSNKLTEKQVLEIFSLTGKEYAYITAKRYNVSNGQIRRIQLQKQWKWLTSTYNCQG